MIASPGNNIFRVLTMWLVLSSLFIPQFDFAQSIGYMGRKLILKTNAINGRLSSFNNLDMEYVMSRKFSLNLFYEHINYGRNENGVRRSTGTVSPRNGRGEYREYSYLKNGTTTGNLFGIGGKIYFNAIIPAPYGLYTSFLFGFGHVSFNDYNVTYDYKEKISSTDLDKIKAKPAVTGLNGEARLYTLDFPSLGYQRIFKRFIVVDTKISVLSQYTPLPDNLSNAFEHNYFVRSNTVSYGVRDFSFGLSVYIKIGILLF